MYYRQAVSEHDVIEQEIAEILAQGSTRYQRYCFWRSPVHGVCITLDGDLQSTERDAGAYHEALVHPAMLAHPNPRRVLICGGGEGATAREVLRHQCVDEVVMCDLDEEFVALCREHVPGWSAGAFDDPRLELRYQDIVEYIGETTKRFDVVIGDVIDLASENENVDVLYGEPFFRALRASLAADGVLATQASALHYADATRHRQIRRALGSVFEAVTSYRATLPSFFVPWGFLVTGQPRRGPRAWLDLFERRVEARRLSLDAFDAPSLASMFMLPPRVRRALRGWAEESAESSPHHPEVDDART